MSRKVFKSIFILLLIALLTLSGFALPSYKGKDGTICDYDESVFEFGTFNDTMYPGVDYYIPLYHLDEPMTDLFFTMYRISFGFLSDDESVSNSRFKSLFEVSELIRDSNAHYYVHIKPTVGTFKNDYYGKIVVYAYDKEVDDNRAAAVLDVNIDFTKEYTTGSSKEDEENISISFVNDGGLVNFSKSLRDERVQIEFYDDSTLSFRLGQNLKYDFRYSTYVSSLLKEYNKEAKIWVYDFYRHPQFENIANLKLKVPSGGKYFYKILPNGELGYITDNISPTGTFGVSTHELGTYIISDALLVNPVYNIFSYSPGNSAAWVKNPNTGVPLEH